MAGRRINDGMGAGVTQQTLKQLIKSGRRVPGAKVIVLGLTFKENCADLRNSGVGDVIRELKNPRVHVKPPRSGRTRAPHAKIPLERRLTAGPRRSSAGNPAILGPLRPLDRRLCVSAFRRICPINADI